MSFPIAGSGGFGFTSPGIITAQVIIVQGTPDGIFIYQGQPASGNLIGSWTSQAGTDSFGNSYPIGINVNQGQLSGVLLTNPQILGAIINNALLTAVQIQQSSMSGGTIFETAITFDTTGGQLLVYATTTTTVTFNTPGTTTWTSPVTGTADVKVWGSDAGGGGGVIGSNGGFGGGGAEFAEEPNYPIVAGQNYDVIVGSGGTGGTSGNAGQDGGLSGFDNTSVFANGGQASNGSPGGTGSNNTIHHDGGNGSSFTGTSGGGGGGRAGSTGPGGDAIGFVGGAAGTGIGGHAGGNGGAANGNGANGGGGGGAGQVASSTSGSNQYRFSASATYYGIDAASGAPPNGKRNNGTMYQGGETAGGGSFNGTMKSLGIIGGNPVSDLAGKSIDSVSIRLENLHSWYNSGMTVLLGYTNRSSLPGSWDGTGETGVKNFHINEGAKQTTDLTGGGLGTAMQSGAAKSISLGAGPAFSLPYYGYFYGAGGDNNQNPLITVTWHTGAAPVQAGSGADGQVQVTYTSGQTLIAAVSPVAGTDANGNAFAAGFTGQIQAIQPASSPALVETWHAMAAFNANFSHGSPVPAYKLNADNTVSLAGIVVVVSGVTSGTVITLPAGYIPISAKKWPVPISAGTPATVANVQVTINSSGNIILSAGPTGAAYSFALDTIRFPLDY